MNNKTKPSDILFVDVKTVSKSKELEENTEEYELFSWKMRDRETDKELSYNKLSTLYHRKAPLYPVFSKIAIITVGYLKDNTLRIKNFTGEEEDIIKDFTKVCGSFLLLGLYNTSFSLPLLRKKAIQYSIFNGSAFDTKFSDIGEKPWTIGNKIIDIMDLWKGMSFLNDGLDDISYMLNHNDSVKTLRAYEKSLDFHKNGISNLLKTSNSDIVKMVKCYLTITGDNSNIETSIIKEIKEVVYKSELDKAVNTKTIDIDKVGEEIKKAKFSKKNLEIANSIVETVREYVES